MGNNSLIGFIHNPLVPKAASLVKSLIQELGIADRSWVSQPMKMQVDDETLDSTSLIVTAGGDGTIIRVVDKVAPHGVPILGINMGRVGFMSELSIERAAERLPWYIDGNALVEERLMLEANAKLGTSSDTHVVAHGLNEIIVRGALPHLLDIDVTIDGARLGTYRADGVIVSTPTGSTGYALSAGGPVLQPEAKVMLIQPLAAHISMQTAVVVPDDSTIELEVVNDDEAVISVDNLTNATLRRGDKVMLKRSPYVGRFLRSNPPSTFYSDLTSRLGIQQRTTHHGHDD